MENVPSAVVRGVVDNDEFGNVRLLEDFAYYVRHSGCLVVDGHDHRKDLGWRVAGNL